MPALTELQRLDLVVEKRRGPTPEYRFRHGLVQEVAYASLVDPSAAKLHKRVGEALEEIYRSRADEAYRLLARHFAEADEPEGGRLPPDRRRRRPRPLRRPRGGRPLPRAPRFLAESATSGAPATRSSRSRSRTTSRSTSRAPRRRTTPRSAAASPTTARLSADGAPRDGCGRRGVGSGDVYTTEAGYFAELLFRGLLLVDRS